MKYYVAIDTNVLVSAMLKASSIPGCVITHALIGDIIPLLNEQVRIVTPKEMLTILESK